MRMDLRQESIKQIFSSFFLDLDLTFLFTLIFEYMRLLTWDELDQNEKDRRKETKNFSDCDLREALPEIAKKSSSADDNSRSTAWDLNDMDLSRSDLSQLDLTWSDLSGSKLVGTNLTGAILSNTELAVADFYNAIIDRTNLQELRSFPDNLSIEQVAAASSISCMRYYLNYCKKNPPFSSPMRASLTSFFNIKPNYISIIEECEDKQLKHLLEILGKKGMGESKPKNPLLCTFFQLKFELRGLAKLPNSYGDKICKPG